MRCSFREATLKDKLVRLLILALMVFAIYSWIGVRAAGGSLVYILLVLASPDQSFITLSRPEASFGEKECLEND
jgi:hypothetical protein